MPSPSRGQFPRSNVTGARPQTIAPGSFAVNWRDKVIWVGDASGNPVRFSRKVEDWNQSVEYAVDDFVVRADDIWRAITPVSAGNPFTPEQWQRLSSAGRAEISQPYASEVYSGGVVGIQAGNTISVASGDGVIIDNTDPARVIPQPISWSTFAAPLAYPGVPFSVVGIDWASGLVHIPSSGFDAVWRRDNIALSYVQWSPAGAITSVRDASVRAGGDSETFRDEYFANGGAYRANGARVKQAAGLLTLRHSSGVVFSLGGFWRSTPYNPNTTVVSANPGMLMVPATAKGGISAPSFNVQTAQYDPNGLGVVTPVPTDLFSIQYLFASPSLDSFILQYGQRTYATQFEALASLNEDWAAYLPVAPGEIVMLMAAVVAQQGVVNLDGAAVLNAAPYGDPFAATGAAVVSSADYYLLDGSRPLAGNMNAAGFRLVDAVLDGGAF